ncbi:MAG: tetratricopeptide repeat protein [Magnetococcales bacterium]|nr:tetratricopeptide repeat protein [Magnetococcales bacterium]
MNRAQRRLQKKLSSKNSAASDVDEIFQKAITYHQSTRIDEAINCYEKVIKLQPDNSIALSNMGVALQSVGRLQEAITSYKKAIKIKPDYVGALSNLGYALTEQGKLEEAVSTLQKAVTIQPDHAEACYNLGNAQKELEKFDEAISSYKKAIEINPQYTDSHYNLGIALQKLNRIDEAAISYQNAINLKPDLAHAYYNLAIILQNNGNLKQAVLYYNKAIEVIPNWAEAYLNLAITQQAQGELDQGIFNCNKAITIQPDFAQAHYNLGNMQREQAKLQEAVISYKNSIAYKNDIAEAHYNLAITLQELGLSEEGKASCINAITINPNYADAHYNLGCHYEKTNNIPLAKKHIKKSLDINPDSPHANCLWAYILRREGLIDEAIELLEPFSQIELHNSEKASLVHFELGKLFDIKKDSKKAFFYITKANMFQSQGDKGQLTNKNRFLSDIKQTKETLTKEWLQTWTHVEEKSDINTPLFLVGFPRSGTTLLDQILDSHPKIEVMEEKPAVYDVKQLINGAYPSSLAELKEPDIRYLQQSYFAAVEHYMTRDTNKILIDKLPLNIRHIALIKRIFPKAKIILALRHPCDVILSNFMQYYKLNSAMSNFLTIEDTIHAYIQVMELWQQSADLLDVDYHTIKYESLIADFNGEVGELLKFIGVEWDDCVLEYNRHAKSRGIINTPSYQSVTEPIYQRAKYRWRRYEEQLAPFINKLDPLIKGFGYSL